MCPPATAGPRHMRLRACGLALAQLTPDYLHRHTTKHHHPAPDAPGCACRGSGWGGGEV